VCSRAGTNASKVVHTRTIGQGMPIGRTELGRLVLKKVAGTSVPHTFSPLRKVGWDGGRRTRKVPALILSCENGRGTGEI
jgi:hypothetical protein